MKRRGFFGAIGGVAVAALAPKVRDVKPEPPKWELPRVRRANGKGFILGVATETVHAGDFVQIQTYGKAKVNTK